MDELYSEFEKLPNNAAKRKFIMDLPADNRFKFLVHIMNKKNLLLSDIMNSLGIWKLE